jgi:lipopolysaccharide biosynthesis glycosyltransferase
MEEEYDKVLHDDVDVLVLGDCVNEFMNIMFD